MKKSTILLFTIILLLMVSCSGNRNQYNDLDDEYAVYEKAIEYVFVPDTEADMEAVTITFKETNTIRYAFGYVSEAQTYERTFFFRDWETDKKLQIIYDTEMLIKNLSAFFNTELWLRRIFAFGGHEQEFRMTTSEVSFCINNKDTLGMLAYMYGNQRVPLWLATGLEAVVRQYNPNAFHYSNLTINTYNFSDIYFSPLFWGTYEREEAISAAYNFVTYLINNGLLNELLRLYTSNEIIEARYKAQNYFYSFAGGLLDVELVVEFIGAAHGDFAIRRSTELGNYNFYFDISDAGRAAKPWYVPYVSFGNIPYLIKGYDMSFSYAFNALICFFDDAILFTKQWYYGTNYTFTPPHFIIYLFSIGTGHSRGGHVDSANRIHMGGLLPVAHEVSHALTRMAPYSPNFAPFDEGFATVIEFQHLYRDKLRNGFFYDWYYRFYYLLDIETLERISPLTPSEQLTKLRTAKRDAIVTSFNRHLYIHVSALLELYVREQVGAFLQGWPNLWCPLRDKPLVYLLYSYTTAASFILYLIEAYDLGKYLQVHWDVHRFEYAYGIPITEMIDKWLLFLEELADAL